MSYASRGHNWVDDGPHGRHCSVCGILRGQGFVVYSCAEWAVRNVREARRALHLEMQRRAPPTIVIMGTWRNSDDASLLWAGADMGLAWEALVRDVRRINLKEVSVDLWVDGEIWASSVLYLDRLSGSWSWTQPQKNGWELAEGREWAWELLLETTKGNRRDETHWLGPRGRKFPTPPGTIRLLDIKDLGWRLLNVCFDAGLSTLGDVAACGGFRITRHPGIGDKTRNILHIILVEHDVPWSDGWNPGCP